MLIPDARSDIRTYGFRRATLWACLIVVLALALTTGLFVKRHLAARERLAELAEQVARLEKAKVSADEVAKLVQDLERVKDRVSNMDEKAGRIETMIGVNGEVAVGGADTGRPLSGAFSRAYKAKQTELLSDLADELGMLDATLDDQGSRVDSLVSYLDKHKKLLSSIPSITPIEGGWLSSAFGYRSDPFTHKKVFHRGVDLSAPKGTSVHVTADGVVGEVKWYADWGYTVEVEHGNGFSTWYAHCSRVLHEPGDQVERGDVISLVGSTGRSTGPHLHYEVHINGTATNPMYYMLDRD